MAKRLQNRRALRVPEDLNTTSEPGEDAAPHKAPAKGKRKAAAGPPKPRKARARKQPPRICAHWCIFDNSMKQVALFDYSQRGLAEERLATIRSTKKGAHWLQIVKLPMAVAEVTTDTASVIKVPAAIA
jgi:hypothetical protein